MNVVEEGPGARIGYIIQRLALSDLYQAYADSLDRGDLERWPGFFTEDGSYRAQARENFDRGLPLAAMFCQGRGMFQDRVTVIAKVMVYAPRTTQHVVGMPRVIETGGGEIHARAQFCVYHTLPHEPTALLAVGRYEDRVVEDIGGRLRFRERTAVYDTLLLPNSLVYPL